MALRTEDQIAAFRDFLNHCGFTRTLDAFEEELAAAVSESARRSSAADVVAVADGGAPSLQQSAVLSGSHHGLEEVSPNRVMEVEAATQSQVVESAEKKRLGDPLSSSRAETSGGTAGPTTPLEANGSVARRASVDMDARALSQSPTRKYGIVTVVGYEEQLWELDESNPLAPEFPSGAGFGLDDYERYLSHLSITGGSLDDLITYVPTAPYMKEAPPTGLTLESFELRVIYEAGRTGFEDVKDFPIVPNTVIAGRYQILQYLDSAAFSRAVKCLDLKHHAEVCIKIIRNSKDFFDQSLDEIKLLQQINSSGNADENCVLQLYDFFYYKEHIFIVCELLRDNLYEFGKYNREHEEEPYFTLPRVQAIARQVLTALAFLQDINLMHCDLKPENILIKSYSRCEIRVIDFGSSCFSTDSLSSYIQSRCYRAPEVILGCHYNGGIDVWSLGCILPELMTGNVLFHNKSVAGMLARIAGVCGPFPQRMLHEGRHTCRYVSKLGVFYEYTKPEDGSPSTLDFHLPHTPPLEQLDLGSRDPYYLDFIKQALTVDYTLRPTAKQLLSHEFLRQDYGPVYSPPPPKRTADSAAASQT